MSPSTNELVNVARTVVDHYHISYSTNRIARLAVNFKRHAPLGDKYLFFEYLSAQIHLSDKQKQAALNTPDLARVIGYADRTGEWAAFNVDHPNQHPRGY